MASDAPTRVLLVDDDPDEFVVVRDLLAEAGLGAWGLDWVAGWDEALAAMIAGHHDAYLVDYRLGARDGIDLLREAIARGCRRPIILLTGHGGREVDVRAMEAGAADYLVKGRFDTGTLERALRYSIRHKALEEELRRSHDELESRVRERTEDLAGANRELQQQVAERRRAEEALKEADRRKDEFLAMLGHELRAPLGPIWFALEVLRQSASPDQLERAREIIGRQVDHLTRIVDDLMDVSRITLGKISLSLEIVPVKDVVAEAIEAVRPFLEKRAHRLVVDVPAGPLHVRADPARLRQVVQNLLVNAAKYTEPGGTVTVAVEPADGLALVRVRDTGLGIAPENLPFVFEPYSQAERTRASADGGIGIGLTIVRQLVSMHGGTVSATSPGIGRGSEFTVRLPAIPA